MVEFYGVSLKKITIFRGHDGEACYQGDIYFNKKKIGYFSDDSMGGFISIDIPKTEDKIALTNLGEKALTLFPKGFINDSIDLKELYGNSDGMKLQYLITTLIEMIDIEKDLKIYLKKGLPVTSYYKESERGVTMIVGLKKKEDFKKFFPTAIELRTFETEKFSFIMKE